MQVVHLHATINWRKKPIAAYTAYTAYVTIYLILYLSYYMVVDLLVCEIVTTVIPAQLYRS